MTYRDQVGALGDRSAARLWALFLAFQDGTYTEDEAVDVMALSVAHANEQATSLADVALADHLTAAVRHPVVPLGLSRPGDDLARLTKATRTLLAALDSTPDVQARVKRLGRSEPLDAAQQARGDGIARSPWVEGWVRTVHGDCQLCGWWARGGRVFHKNTPMPRHKGCRCEQAPVIKQTSSYQTDRQARAAARRRGEDNE